ncbi:hypothetical protein ACFYP0_12125 [Micromonospora arida]|uniref:hypothetical protein n=1 Tax=Micromonospora arida TaxID=2203715 RepID=UPI0036D0158A
MYHSRADVVVSVGPQRLEGGGPCDACGQTWPPLRIVHCGGLDGCHELFSSDRAYWRHLTWSDNGCDLNAKGLYRAENSAGRTIWRM